MKAWRLEAYGAEGNPADAIAKLKLEESVAVPEPKAGQVQVKVAYAGVNPIDWKLFSGGLHGICPCQFPYTPGFDVSGTISAVGEGVTGFAVGDEVAVDIGLVESCCDPPAEFGPAGAFAEYATAPTDIVVKTGGVDLKQAAALPLAGLTAYQAMFTGAGRSFAGADLFKVQAGQKVFIIGGTTLVSMYAIQLAKNAGAHVAVTASSKPMPDGTSKADFAKSLGADEVIDYESAEWSDVLAGKDYDLIFDTVGKMEDWTTGAPKVLKKGGEFISVANFGEAASTDDHTFKVFLLKSNAADLDVLMGMVRDGKLKCPVDSVVEFADVPAALTKSMSMRAAGKLLVKVGAA